MIIHYTLISLECMSVGVLDKQISIFSCHYFTFECVEILIISICQFLRSVLSKHVQPNHSLCLCSWNFIKCTNIEGAHKHDLSYLLWFASISFQLLFACSLYFVTQKLSSDIIKTYGGNIDSELLTWFLFDLDSGLRPRHCCVSAPSRRPENHQRWR